jgi:hypothetical protein
MKIEDKISIKDVDIIFLRGSTNTRIQAIVDSTKKDILEKLLIEYNKVEEKLSFSKVKIEKRCYDDGTLKEIKVHSDHGEEQRVLMLAGLIAGLQFK